MSTPSFDELLARLVRADIRFVVIDEVARARDLVDLDDLDAAQPDP